MSDPKTDLITELDKLATTMRQGLRAQMVVVALQRLRGDLYDQAIDELITMLADPGVIAAVRVSRLRGQWDVTQRMEDELLTADGPEREKYLQRRAYATSLLDQLYDLTERASDE